jgi:phosphoglycerate dehydrogenase-like enzyme
MQPHTRPVVVVLHDAERPPGMREIERLAEVRYATDDRLADALPGADVLFVWRPRVTGLLRAWPRAGAVRWVHTTGAGLPLPAGMIGGDVLVTGSRGLFDEPIAEYVVGLVLAFAKDLPGRIRRQDSRAWQSRTTERVAGRTALVAGTGTIARAIGRKLSAVGMAVSGVGRQGRVTDPDLGAVLPMDRLVDALRRTDYLVLATPLTDDTRGMVDARALAAMRPAARVINVSRGALVVPDDLVDALRRGRIAGAALDIFRDEWPAGSSPLWELPNVLISPHMSGRVNDFADELVALFADNLARYIARRQLRNVVANPHAGGEGGH